MSVETEAWKIPCLHCGGLTTRDAKDSLDTKLLEPAEQIFPYNDLRHFDG